MNLINTFFILIQSAASQGMLWALLAIGVYLTFRILDIADLTAEGSFPLGAGIAAVSITNGLSLYGKSVGLLRRFSCRICLRDLAYQI